MKRRAEKSNIKSTENRDNVVEQSLREIYQVDGENLPDLTKLERRRSHLWLWITLIVSGVLLTLAAAAWAGFWYFQGFQSFGDNGLVLAIEGPEQISLGQEVTYFINYRNQLHEPLGNVELRVNFPPDFVTTHNHPASTDQALWKLGDLASEQSGTVTIRGKFMGALGTMSAIQAMATYRPSSYSKDLQAIAGKSVSYAQTVLEGWIQVPEKSVPGDSLALIYHIKNTGSDPMEGLEVRLVLPDGFSLDSATLNQGQIDGRTYKKQIPILAAGTSTEVSVIGVFASGYGGDAKVTGQVGTTGKDGTFLAAQKAEAIFPVLAGDLSLKLVVNGSDAATRSVQFGDQLLISIGYENNSDEPLKNVKLRLAVETVALDQKGETLDKVQFVDLDSAAKNSSSTREGNGLSWDVKSYPAFSEIAAHSQGSLETSLSLTAKATGTRPMAVRLTVTADMEVGKVKRSIHMAPMFFKLRSDVSFTSQARYYTEEGAPLGSGPLPPKIGQATTYRIIWSLNKHIHSLKDLEAAAVLPNSVRFVSLATTTAGALAYDADKREVRWTLNRMPANVNNAEVEFDVELTPTLADDGRFAQLLGDATFAAQDEGIAEPIIQTAKALTTDLKNDDIANGKGVVRKDVQ